MYSTIPPMSHTLRDKKKLLDRIRRILGQMQSIEGAVDQEKDCSSILQTLAACRGAINGLMLELLEGHIQLHVLDPHRKITFAQQEATEELLQILKTYLK